MTTSAINPTLPAEPHPLVTMKSEVEDKLNSLGCLAVFVGVCAFGYLAFSSRWFYAIPSMVLIAGWLRVVRHRREREHRRNSAALRDSFAPSKLPLPELDDGQWHYGYPAFTLTFPSEAALHEAEAAGCIEAFKQAIQALYAHVGGKKRPFDANVAVYATFKGQRYF